MKEITRRRLKKKVLDRWENEGGKVCNVPPAAPHVDEPSKMEARTTRRISSDEAAGDRGKRGPRG